MTDVTVAPYEGRPEDYNQPPKDATNEGAPLLRTIGKPFGVGPAGDVVGYARTGRTDLVYGSTKTYAANVGLSAAFRQHPADSHCNMLHGYALEVIATFEADDLDARNWVMDFGGLKTFKQWLEQMFDHTVVIAADDPMLPAFKMMAEAKVIDLRVVKATGCEATALLIFEWLETWLLATNQGPRVRVEKLEVREHAGNSAYVRRRERTAEREDD